MLQVIQCVSAFFACLGFAWVFRIHHNTKFALLTSFGGMLSWVFYLLFEPHFGNALGCLFSMTCVALYGELMARHLKTPASLFIIIGCFPLVPGKGIYQTMLYLVLGNQELFIQSLLTTVQTAFAIAVAILIVSTVFKVIKNVKGFCS